MSFDVQTPNVPSTVGWDREEAVTSARSPRLRDGMTAKFRITRAEVKAWPKNTEYSAAGDLFLELQSAPAAGDGTLTKYTGDTIVGLPFRNADVEGHTAPLGNAYGVARFMNAIMPSDFQAFPTWKNGSYHTADGNAVAKGVAEELRTEASLAAGQGFIEKFYDNMTALVEGGYEFYGTVTVKNDRVKIKILGPTPPDGVAVETNSFLG